MPSVGANLGQTRADQRRFKADLTRTGGALEVKIQEAKVELLKWMTPAFIITLGALLATLIKSQ